MKKKLVALLLTMVMSVSLLAGCGGSEKPAESKPAADSKAPAATETTTDTAYTIKLATPKNSDSYMVEGLKKFKEITEEASGGSLTIELYPDSTLGGQVEIMEGMGMNTIEMAYISAGATESFYPESGIPGTLFLPANEDHAMAIWQCDFTQDILERMAGEINIRCLDFSLEGTRNIWSAKPIEKLEDLAGVKLRVPELPMFINSFTALGANPTPMAFAEIYTGLQTGIIDGLEYDTAGVLSSNFNDMCKYCYETSHGVSVMTFMITETMWQQMSDAQREAISKGSKEASDWLNEQYYVELENAKTVLADSGVTFVTPTAEERALMAELLQPVTESIINGRCSMEELDALRNLSY